MTNLPAIKKELDNALGDPKTMEILLGTAFKGLTVQNAKAAATEWVVVRGGKLEDFFNKDVYAIPYKDGYSLITSIDYSRKIGMRSGVMGVSAPKYVFDEAGKLETCEITVKRRVGNDVGEFTALVYFDEYSTGRNLWTTKPRSMIAKVAEMHALRKACPEELAQSYVEEEMLKEAIPAEVQDAEDWELKLRSGADEGGLEGLAKVWAKMPGALKSQFEALKNELKAKLQSHEEPVIQR